MVYGKYVRSTGELKKLTKHRYKSLYHRVNERRSHAEVVVAFYAEHVEDVRCDRACNG